MWRENDLVNSMYGGLGRITEIRGKHICVKFVSGNSLFHTADELQTPMCTVNANGREYVCQILEIYEEDYDVLWNGQVHAVVDITRVGLWNEFSPQMAQSDFVRIPVDVTAA